MRFSDEMNALQFTRNKMNLLISDLKPKDNVACITSALLQNLDKKFNPPFPKKPFEGMKVHTFLIPKM